MPSWISARNGLIAIALITVAGCGGGWWFLGGDDPETTTKPQIVTGPAAAASAPAPKPATTPPPQPTPPAEKTTATTEPTTPAAPTATDDPAPAESPVEPDEKTTPTTTTNPLRCDQLSWRAGVGPLKGHELTVNIADHRIPAHVTAIFLGGEVSCVDGRVHLKDKPLSVDDLVAADGFTNALQNSRSKTLKVADGREVDVGHPFAGMSIDNRRYAPVATAK